jgi:hypothetical protein
MRRYRAKSGTELASSAKLSLNFGTLDKIKTGGEFSRHDEIHLINHQ